MKKWIKKILRVSPTVTDDDADYCRRILDKTEGIFTMIDTLYKIESADGKWGSIDFSYAIVGGYISDMVLDGTSTQLKIVPSNKPSYDVLEDLLTYSVFAPVTGNTDAYLEYLLGGTNTRLMKVAKIPTYAVAKCGLVSDAIAIDTNRNVYYHPNAFELLKNREIKINFKYDQDINDRIKVLEKNKFKMMRAEEEIRIAPHQVVTIKYSEYKNENV